MPDQLHRSPMHARHEQREAYFLPYAGGDTVTEVVETFGDLDMEYAAIRKGCVIFDEPHVGTIRSTGAERLPFLNRMLTAKVDDLKPGDGARSFWLNRKGRIDADLRIAELEDEMLLAADRHLCKPTAEALDQFVFGEDITITDASDGYHRLSIHGPAAPQLLALAADAEAQRFTDLAPLACTRPTVAGVPVAIQREDICGEPGYHLCLKATDTESVYRKLIELTELHPELKARETGWMAINAARIESGRPMFNLDFGPDNLPVESGIVDQRVHFAKGCYLGQEVVARMHARGAYSKKIVALRIEDERITPEHTEIHQPTTGSQVFEHGKAGETPIGAVTSSTISPMLGAIPICFAMVKAGKDAPGTKLTTTAEGALVTATVQDSLVFYDRYKPFNDG